MDTDNGQSGTTCLLALLACHCEDTRAKKISLLITTMVTGYVVPLSLEGGEGLCKLMAFIKPPSGRTTATKMKKMYQESTELTADLQCVEKVVVIRDSWTALTMESYITITCHFIQNSI